MKTYLECAKLLDELLAGARAVRITVPEYLPISVEEIGVSQDGHRLVSLCQYGEQNGDLMSDCDTSVVSERLPGDRARCLSVRRGGQTYPRRVLLETGVDGVCSGLVGHAPRTGILCPYGGSRDPVSVSSSIHSGA